MAGGPPGPQKGERKMTYRGIEIEKNIYGQGEFTVQWCGDDVWFTSEEDAMMFIDSMME